MARVRTVWKWIVLGGGLTLLAACGSSAAARGGAQPSTAATSIAVTGNEFSFTPGKLTAKVGQPVTVVFNNAGKIDHDWAIAKIPVTDEHAAKAAASSVADEHEGDAEDADHAHAGEMPDVHVAAKVGAQAEVAFTPSTAGTYDITCTIPGHTESGMRGMLTVVN